MVLNKECPKCGAPDEGGHRCIYCGSVIFRESAKTSFASRPTYGIEHVLEYTGLLEIASIKVPWVPLTTVAG